MVSSLILIGALSIFQPADNPRPAISENGIQVWPVKEDKSIEQVLKEIRSIIVDLKKVKEDMIKSEYHMKRPSEIDETPMKSPRSE